jgi:hypothetical protein
MGHTLELGTFRIDGTPPVGCGVGFGLGDRTTGVRDPLYVRGFLLKGTDEACLIVSADWCGLMNSAYRDLQAALARGAGVPVDRVIIHSVHQHDAPIVAFEVELLLGRETYPRSWWRAILAECETAASEANARRSPVAEVGWALTAMEGYASSRRVLGADGKLLGSRWSRTTDPALLAAPVGTIDPMLRTVALRDREGQLMASLSFYATHPQVSNGQGRYSADAPGEAMRILGQTDASAQHALFIGCSGNVTAGKYTSATDLEGNLVHFGRILADGVLRNHAGMHWGSAGGLTWATAAFPFPSQVNKPTRLRAELADPSVPHTRKQIAAPVLAAMKDPENATYVLTRVGLGPATLLFFPGEPFVEYQLYAQNAAPGRLVAAAGNCGDSFLYLPRAVSFAEGGYEVESYCWCTPEIETRLETAIRVVLA